MGPGVDDDEITFISNSEVLHILEKNQSIAGLGGGLKRNTTLQDLHTVEKEALIYLRKTGIYLDKEKMTACMSLFNEHNLTVGEKLVLLNIQPRNIVELHPVSGGMSHKQLHIIHLAC